MASTRGRQVVVPLTNKSGGSVAAGDVVVIDTANDTAFTTTTSARSEVSLGVAQETIANNSSGRVLISGYAALINVPASVTRGHYIETHTVAKQATGNSTRRSGSFGQFLTGGTTPTGWLWGSTDQTATGSSNLAGKELDYVQFTSDVSITATTGATANNVVSGSSVSYDGATVVLIEFYADGIKADTGAAGRLIDVVLYDGSTELGILARQRTPAAAENAAPCHAARRLTPSNASHTYHIKAYVSAGTGTVFGGAGTAGNHMPGFIRITRVSD